jgi:hypothetical protein
MPLDEKRKGGVGGRWTPARSRSFGEGGGVERETTLPPSSSLRTILPPLRDMVYR